MAKIAMLTTGPLLTAIEDSKNASYGVLADKIFSALSIDDGFLGHSATETNNSWGVWAIPKLYQKEEYEGRIIQTLSLWRDLESLHAFSYNGFHAEALKRRSEWFPKLPLPNNVIWWVDDDHRPTWQEGATRYDCIAKEGPTADAFNFKQAYSASGQLITLDRELIKQKAKQYK
jgi:Domain of unknown function (DUF3291)